jgi:hypothetical protein
MIQALTEVTNAGITTGQDPVIEAYKRDVDRTLIRHNLGLTVQQRLENLEACLRDAAELRQAMRKATGR